MELRLHEYTLPLKHPFKISRGTVTVQQSLIVELQQDGVSGYGEAVSSTYYNSPIETMRKHLEGMQPLLAGETLRGTNSFWNLCAKRLAHRFQNELVPRNVSPASNGCMPSRCFRIVSIGEL